jgi:Ni/Fe-hydrogenase subunit HybB-like protein
MSGRNLTLARPKALPRLSFWLGILGLLFIAGIYITFRRFTGGLGATTALSDEFPWGLWIGFDVLCGVGLAAGGFTIAATVYIFNLQKYRPILRPTILTAFLGYLLVIFALLYDLGKPWNIWHPLIMWNPRSVMFEVAWCVMLYTAVLALEFLPAVLERFGWKRAITWHYKMTLPLVVAGVILSTLHQSSLGSLYLIVPEKLYPLWYTPLLPVFFFISAISVGLAMVIFESFLSSRAFRKQLELELLTVLARVMVVVLAVYALFRAEDLLHRGAWKYLWMPRGETYLFWLEVALGVIAPAVLLSFARIRRNLKALYASAIMVIFGFVANRLNVAITGMERGLGRHYFPTWMELTLTLFIVSLGFAIFALAVKYLPVFGEEKAAAPEKAPALTR